MILTNGWSFCIAIHHMAGWRGYTVLESLLQIDLISLHEGLLHRLVYKGRLRAYNIRC